MSDREGVMTIPTQNWWVTIHCNHANFVTPMQTPSHPCILCNAHMTVSPHPHSDTLKPWPHFPLTIIFTWISCFPQPHNCHLSTHRLSCSDSDPVYPYYVISPHVITLASPVPPILLCFVSSIKSCLCVCIRHQGFYKNFHPLAIYIFCPSVIQSTCSPVYPFFFESLWSFQVSPPPHLQSFVLILS